jgi:hypothetical protein
MRYTASIRADGSVEYRPDPSGDLYLASEVDGVIAAKSAHIEWLREELDRQDAEWQQRAGELEATVATLTAQLESAVTEEEAVANQQRWDELLDEREQALSRAFDSEVRTQGEAVKWRTAAERAEAAVATLTWERDELQRQVQMIAKVANEWKESSQRNLQRVAALRAGQAAGAAEGVSRLQDGDVEHWRTLYRALAWMVNDYIGVCGLSMDFTQKHERLGYAHEGYHNAHHVLREKPPVPEGMRQGIRCTCWAKERGVNAGTPHTHYDEPPYRCARCECEGYTPVAAAGRDGGVSEAKK